MEAAHEGGQLLVLLHLLPHPLDLLGHVPEPGGLDGVGPGPAGAWGRRRGRGPGLGGDGEHAAEAALVLVRGVAREQGDEPGHDAAPAEPPSLQQVQRGRRRRRCRRAAPASRTRRRRPSPLPFFFQMSLRTPMRRLISVAAAEAATLMTAPSMDLAMLTTVPAMISGRPDGRSKVGFAI